MSSRCRPLVDIGTVDLDSAASLPVAAALLSPDEAARMERMGRDSDRRAFACGRVILRALLGRRLGVPPEDIRFQAEPGRKPRLAHPSRAGVGFSVSHSGALVYGAVAMGTCVGVDVQLWVELDVLRFARRHLAAAEVEALEGLDEGARLKRFSDIWCRKEAFMKATGRGIGTGPSSFAVATTTNRVCPVGRASAFAVDWWVGALPSPSGYSAALCVRGDAPLVRTVPDGDIAGVLQRA